MFRLSVLLALMNTCSSVGRWCSTVYSVECWDHLCIWQQLDICCPFLCFFFVTLKFVKSTSAWFADCTLLWLCLRRWLAREAMFHAPGKMFLAMAWGPGWSLVHLWFSLFSKTWSHFEGPRIALRDGQNYNGRTSVAELECCWGWDGNECSQKYWGRKYRLNEDLVGWVEQELCPLINPGAGASHLLCKISMWAWMSQMTSWASDFERKERKKEKKGRKKEKEEEKRRNK